MREFGEKLAELIDKYHVKAADICNKTGINKAYFSKMKSGALIPKDCSIVREIADVIGISDDEKIQLCRIYCNSKLGKKHMNIEQALNRIYNMSDRDYTEYSDLNSFVASDGTVITDKENIKSVIRKMISQSGSFNMILAACNEDLFYMISEELHKNNNVESRCLLYLEDNEFSDYNVNMFSDIIPVVLTEKADIRYDYADISALAEHSLMTQLFIGDNNILLTDSSCTTAIYLEKEHAINSYIKMFEEKYNQANKLCKVFSDISDFINGNEEIFDDNSESEFQDVYIMKNCPCIMLETNSDVINQHFKDDTTRVEFVKKYMDFIYRQIITGIKKQHVMFSINGIDHILNANEYYEYNKYIDYPVSKELRRKFFEQIVDIAGKTEVISVNIFEGFFSADKQHCMNIWSGGKLLLFMNFEDGYRILIMKNENIVSAILRCFSDFKNIGYIYSKENTLDIMREKL